MEDQYEKKPQPESGTPCNGTGSEHTSGGEGRRLLLNQLLPASVGFWSVYLLALLSGAAAEPPGGLVLGVLAAGCAVFGSASVDLFDGNTGGRARRLLRWVLGGGKAARLQDLVLHTRGRRLRFTHSVFFAALVGVWLAVGVGLSVPPYGLALGAGFVSGHLARLVIDLFVWGQPLRPFYPLGGRTLRVATPGSQTNLSPALAALAVLGGLCAVVVVGAALPATQQFAGALTWPYLRDVLDWSYLFTVLYFALSLYAARVLISGVEASAARRARDETGYASGVRVRKLNPFPEQEISSHRIVSVIKGLSPSITPENPLSLEYHFADGQTSTAIAADGLVGELDNIAHALDDVVGDSELDLRDPEAFVLPPGAMPGAPPQEGSSGLVPVVLEARLSGRAVEMGLEGVETLEKDKRGYDYLSAPLKPIERLLDYRSGERAVLQISICKAPQRARETLEKALEAYTPDEEGEARSRERSHRRARMDFWERVFFTLLRGCWGIFAWAIRAATRSNRPRKEAPEARVVRGRIAQNLYGVSVRLLVYLKEGGSFTGRAKDARRAFENYLVVFQANQNSFLEVCSEKAGSKAAVLRAAEVELRRPSEELERSSAEAALTEEETGALWRPLGKTAKISSRQQTNLLTLPLPNGAPESGYTIGHSNDPRSMGRRIMIPPSGMTRHVILNGITGNGKSSAFHSMISDAIDWPEDQEETRPGFAVVDPKNGELIEEVIYALPERLHDEVIIVDLASEHPSAVYNYLAPESWIGDEDMGFNIVAALEAIWPNGFGGNNRPLMSNGFFAGAAYNRLLTEQGLPPTETLLSFSEFGFFETRKDLDVRKNLYEVPERRERVLTALKESGEPELEDLIRYWEKKDEDKNADKQSGEFNSVVNKIAQLRAGEAKKFFGAPARTFSLMEAMEAGKIILLNLSAATFSGDSAQIMGRVFINTLGRCGAARHQRAVHQGRQESLRQFILFVDEVQNFVCPELHKILTEGRSQRLSLVAGTQNITQINDPILREGFANAGTKLIFGTTQKDARELCKLVGDPFTEETIAKIPQHNFIAVQDGSISTGTTIPMPEATERTIANARTVRERAAVNYGNCGSNYGQRDPKEREEEMDEIREDGNPQSPEAPSEPTDAPGGEDLDKLENGSVSIPNGSPRYGDPDGKSERKSLRIPLTGSSDSPEGQGQTAGAGGQDGAAKEERFFMLFGGTGGADTGGNPGRVGSPHDDDNGGESTAGRLEETTPPKEPKEREQEGEEIDDGI